MKKFNNFLIFENETLKSSMKKISKNQKNIIYVYNSKKQITSSLSDGDIRRHLLKNGSIDDPVYLCSNKNFKFIKDLNERENILKLLDKKYKSIPVLDKNNKIIDIIDRSLNLISSKKKIIRARAPARLSIAGGGTDITNYFFDKGGTGISLTISKYCNVHLIKRNDNKIIIVSNDFKKKEIIKNFNEIKYNGTLDVIKASIKLLKPDFGFEIYIETDYKPGSGLGGSAALSSCVIGAINYLQNIKLNKYEIAELAFQAERIELGILGGWQDQYSTVFGGCNFMEFRKNSNLVQKLLLPNDTLDELERRLIICDTNIKHKGSIIHKKNQSNKNLNHYGKRIKFLVEEIRVSLLTGKINQLGKLIQQTWDLKKQLHKSMTNNKIRLMEKKLCRKNLADGCRLLGTGGGGHILFYIKPQNRFNFLKKLSQLKINYYKVKLDQDGLKVWDTDI